MNLKEIVIRPVESCQEQQYQELMQRHHYLGCLPKIGETIRYVAFWRDEWIALADFSAAAWKCRARDRFIGWDFRHQYARLKLLANNSRFLILPQWHVKNLGSRILSLCQKRLPRDWRERFGHPVLLLETFVDPQRFRGTVYRSANWLYVGDTRGFRRTSHGYSARDGSPKMVFLKPLHPRAQKLLSSPVLKPYFYTGGTKLMLKAEQMLSLPGFFKDIPDPRRAQGKRHALPTVLAISAGGVLCGMRGYKAIADWARSLGPKARQRFGCRREKTGFVVPSEYIIRDVLIRVEPCHLDQALQRWNTTYATKDQSLAIDGKTMCNAIDDDGHQAHIMSVVGHQSKICHTQKKWAPCP